MAVSGVIGPASMAEERNMKVKPIGEKILVQRLEAESKTAGGKPPEPR